MNHYQPSAGFFGGYCPPASTGPELTNYKTKRCRHFDAGKCKLGGLCNFAHGDEELRQFKTEEFIKNCDLKAMKTPAKFAMQNSSAKISMMEKYLESFYASQKHLLEQLKFLTLNLNGAGANGSEEHVGLLGRDH